MTIEPLPSENSAETLPVAPINDKQNEIRAGLNRQLFRRARSALIGMPLTALLLALSLKNQVDNTILLIWIFFILLVSLVRSLMIYRFDLAEEDAQKNSTWLQGYFALEIAAGLLWGVTAFVLKDLTLYYEMVVYLALAGMMMGAAMILATSAIILAAFALSSGATFAAITYITMQDDVHFIISLLIVLFTFVVIFVTYVLKKDIERTLSLSFENSLLLQHLQKANGELRKHIQQSDSINRDLSQSRNELSRIFDNMQDMFFRIDSDDRICLASPSSFVFLGYQPTELLSRRFSDLLHTPRKFDELMSRLQRTEYVRNYEVDFASKDGKIIWGSVNAKWITDEHGKHIGIEGTIRDINENRITANALVKARDEFKELLDFNNEILRHAPIGIIILSKSKRIKYMNPAMNAILGYTGTEQNPSIGQVISDVSTVKQAGLLEKAAGFFASGEAFNIEAPYRSLVGKESYLEIKGVPLLDNGEFNGAIVITSDISLRVQHEQKLKQARDREHAASVAKSQFIANMNHELRTPLNAIIGIAEIMQREITEQSLLDHLQVILTAGHNLHEMVKNILNLAQIESGSFQKHLRTFELKPYLENTAQPYVENAQNKALQFSIKIEDNVPSSITSESNWLSQVFKHLLSNAVKFTHQGSITIRVNLEPPRTIRFEIIDTGIGIEKSKLPFIFEHFYQADSSLTRTYGGTGLGTTIAKEFIGALGGKIGVESEIGKGTTVYFTIPIDPKEAKTADDVAVATMQHFPHKLQSGVALNVLVAEDNVVNQMVMRKMLETLGHRVTLVANGKAAVDALEADDFDLIVMDIQMPILNGIEATQMIRRFPDSHKANVPIIAVTAHMLLGDLEDCQRSGMDACVEKPVTLVQLQEVLNSLSK